MFKQKHFSGNGLKKMITNKYMVYIEKKSYNSERKIPSKCRIGETCSTYIAVIGDKSSMTIQKKMNHVHKDTKDFLYYNNSRK